MPNQLVTFEVQSSTTTDPVDGVLIRIYDSSHSMVTEVTSGAAGPGTATVVLNGDDPAIPYTLQFGAVGSIVEGPLSIDVGPQDQTYQIPALVFEDSRELAPNPDYCRASGYVIYQNGKPRKDFRVTFHPCVYPLGIRGTFLSQEEICVTSNQKGYISVDLPRNGHLWATFPSAYPVEREIVIPDSPSVSILDLLYPRLRSITVTNPLTVSVDETLTVPVTVELTSGVEVPIDQVPTERLTVESEDPEVAIVSRNPGGLSITGVSAGSIGLVVRDTESRLTVVPQTPIQVYPEGLHIEVVP